jgi:hypothetical protein
MCLDFISSRTEVLSLLGTIKKVEGNVEPYSGPQISAALLCFRLHDCHNRRWNFKISHTHTHMIHTVINGFMTHFRSITSFSQRLWLPDCIIKARQGQSNLHCVWHTPWCLAGIYRRPADTLQCSSHSLWIQFCFAESFVKQILDKKNKNKAVPLHAMEADGGRGGIAPTHS